MTIDRDGVKGPYLVDCDVRGCREGLETNAFTFSQARDAWREAGWMAHYNSNDDRWYHLCPKHEQELQAGELDEQEIG